jgi:hypothetical protein
MHRNSHSGGWSAAATARPVANRSGRGGGMNTVMGTIGVLNVPAEAPAA